MTEHALHWETAGTSRIPFAVYTDEQRHKKELERFFYRGHWSYVGLEAEIPAAGDFKRTKVGERSVLIQHRLRIEHRWSRPNDVGASWIFRNRWRYRFTLKLPLFGKDIDKRSLYAIPINVETILQSGAPVGGAILEDLRIYPSIGYKFNYRVAVTGGLMYTTGQVLGEPTRFNQRFVPRLNLFWTPDLRHRATRMPEPRLYE